MEPNDGVEWRPVVGYEGSYEVSSLGVVRSLLTGKTLRASRAGRYLAVSLRLAGRTSTRTVHRIVGEAFLGPRPAGMETCHGVGGPLDNRAANLRYDTHHANMRDTLTHGTHPSVEQRACSKGHALGGDNVYLRRFASADGGTKLRRRCRVCLKAKSLRDVEEARNRRASRRAVVA